MAQPAQVDASPGLVLSRYRPLRPLGSGASGSVWLAQDEVSGLDVALKIVAREGRAAARAEREAEAAARLRHPRCLRAYDLGHDSRHVYIAYEYLPGRTLRDAMRAGELDDAGAVEAAAQILDGLAHAHAHGVVHRDVKPTNVLLVDGDELSVRLLDFGLAVLDEAETLTAAGDVPGTLAYVPPERLAGSDAGPAADVWAVGVILWELLAGEHPFWKPSLLESARAIEAGAPPLQAERPDLPKPLLAAVAAALAPEPDDRPTAADLAASLRGSLAKRRRPRPSVRVDLPPVRRAAAAALAGVGAGLGAAALPFYPAGWPAALGVLAAGAAAWRPPLGLAVALAAPILPLGNLSLGLALLYAAVAVAWLAVFAREPEGGALPALGPLLGPLAALAFVPALVLFVRSPARRALVAVAVVLLAALASGLRRSPLPLTGDQPPLGLGLAGSDAPVAVAGALWQTLLDQPAVAVCALVLAAAAAAFPLARRPWEIAGVGAAVLAAILLGAPQVAALPVVLAVWATCVPLIAHRR